VPTLPAIAAALRSKLRETEDSRFWLRFYASLLAAAGLTYEESAQILGISARSVRRWLREYQENGDSAFQEQTPTGRPAQLTPDQIDALDAAIRTRPREAGLDVDAWTGKAVCEWLQRRFAISLTDRRARQILASIREKNRPK
jgi:transposase